MASTRHEDTAIAKVTGWTWMTASDWKRSWKPWLRGTLLGFPIGALPVGGAEIPTFLSYWLEKRLSRHPEEFGHGAIEGVAGPEAANNAAATGVLVPLLTFGLPTSATAAIMLAAFQQYSLQPGPLLFESNPELVWGLIASLYIGNVMLLILNLPMAPTLGTAARDPAAAALCQHRAVRDGRQLQPQQLGVRRRPGVPDWIRRVSHEAARHPCRAGHPRLDPGTDRRAAVPAGAGDLTGRWVGVFHQTAVGALLAIALAVLLAPMLLKRRPRNDA